MPGGNDEMKTAGSLFGELEHALRKHGVRVEPRLALLQRLLAEDSGDELRAQQDALLDRVRKAAARLREESQA